tara:strand:- start:95997 stop:96302 length:306 start_codon:yes stop_codon:yes gene_type:complete
MKLTKSKLKKIIKEEISKLSETFDIDIGTDGTPELSDEEAAQQDVDYLLNKMLPKEQQVARDILASKRSDWWSLSQGAQSILVDILKLPSMRNHPAHKMGL